MMNLQSENHSVQVLAALQKKTRNGCDIFLSGNDNSRYQSDSLWILSPLVRSTIDSVGNIRDNLIILPDFSYDDIKTGLEITEGNRREVLRFNSSTKHLMEILGVDLSDIWTGGDVSMNSYDLNLEIKTEKPQSSDEGQDDDGDDIQKQFLAQNPDFDSSDDEEDTEHDDVTVDELTPSLNVKLVDI